MACSEIFGSSRNHFEQYPLPLPLYDGRVDDGRAAGSTRVLKKQSPVRAGAADTPGTIRPDEIFERSRERREQRKLKRVAASVKTQATTFNPAEVESPGTPSHGFKPHPPPYTIEEITNQLNAPNKLTRKSPNRTVPNGWYQPNPGSPLTAPVGSHQTSPNYEPSIPYSESRGELQRQFDISQRLQRKHQPGSPNPLDVGAYLGGLERPRDEDGWVDGFRIEVEKPLQRVYGQRLQGGNRGSLIRHEKPTRVRFAPVVECFEF